MSLTKIMQEIRARHKAKAIATAPTAVWTGKDLFNGKPLASLTIILQTTGCRWRSCTMCGYVYDSSSKTLSHDEIMKQLEYAMLYCKDEDIIVKIFTSGSFLDDEEIPSSTRKEMLLRLASDKRVKKVIVETRPEYVTREKISECVAILDKPFEIAIGLETSNDMIRKDCINKGFTFSDFVKASNIAHKEGATVKAYLLLKPIFLSEGLALKDTIKSIQDCVKYVETISVNLCNVQKGTLVEEMFQHRDYRPPWLWSGVEVLKKGKKTSPETVLISDPVGAGSQRGAHNCGRCDNAVEQAILSFSLTQDINVFNDLDCDCIELWKKVIVLEDFTFGSPLVR